MVKLGMGTVCNSGKLKTMIQFFKHSLFGKKKRPWQTGVPLDPRKARFAKLETRQLRRAALRRNAWERIKHMQFEGGRPPRRRLRDMAAQAARRGFREIRHAEIERAKVLMGG